MDFQTVLTTFHFKISLQGMKSTALFLELCLCTLRSDYTTMTIHLPIDMGIFHLQSTSHFINKIKIYLHLLKHLFTMIIHIGKYQLKLSLKEGLIQHRFKKAFSMNWQYKYK